MRNNVQLYINNQLVDLFDFEDINIKDSIQDVRDIAKVFVPFSRQFTVPASKNNNIIFKHYHNNSIVDSFDARFKVSAVIKINGVIYKKGRITLTGVTVKNDRPVNYKLVFHSSTIDLKTVLGDDMLSDINSPTLDKYKIDYTDLNVFYGFAYGWNLVGDVMEYDDIPLAELNDETQPKDLIFPFISTNNYYYYDSADGASPLEGDTQSRNIHIGATGDTRGVYYRDLRAGIRLPIIINAIEEFYADKGISFSSTFFTNEEFNRLYLYLQKERGLYESHAEINFLLSDATQSGDNVIPIITTRIVSYNVTLTVTVVDSNDDFSIKVINTEDNSTEFEGEGKGNTVFNFNIETETEKLHTLKFIVNDFTSANISFNIVIKRKLLFFPDGEGIYDYSVTGAVNKYSVLSELPKIKVIDFLTSLFKMFNLTAYININDEIVIETLDDYYTNGTTVDVTRFIKAEDVDITRNNLYSSISFEFEEPSTFAVLNSNELSGDVFGNEIMVDVNEDDDLRNILAFDGGKYEIKPKFEKIQYERMNDQNDEAISTDIGWGWLVDKDQKSKLTKPLLFYAENMALSGATTPAAINFSLDVGYLTPTNYYRPSNSISNASIQRQSLHFGSEYDEFYFGLGSNEVSLFTRYWKNTILEIYSKKSRITSLKGHFPVSIINTLELNDTLVIRGKKYRINKLDINITTGDVSLELVTYREIVPYYGITVDTDTYTVDSGLITIDKIR